MVTRTEYPLRSTDGMRSAAATSGLEPAGTPPEADWPLTITTISDAGLRAVASTAQPLITEEAPSMVVPSTYPWTSLAIGTASLPERRRTPAPESVNDGSGGGG